MNGLKLLSKIIGLFAAEVTSKLIPSHTTVKLVN